MRRRPYESPYLYGPQSNEDYMYYGPIPQQQSYDPYYSQFDPQPYQTPFQYYAKPNQPDNWPEFMQNNPNFYPPPGQNPKNSILTQFQDTNGQLDVEKVLSTMSQLAHTVQQIPPVIQQVGSIIKIFR